MEDLPKACESVEVKNWKDWSAETDKDYSNRCIVAFDLDDTLTVEGALPAAVLSELEAVEARGWLRVLVTGRSAGWADAIIKLLPFDAVVAENGAVLYLWPEGRKNKKPFQEPTRKYWTPQCYSEHLASGMQERFASTLLSIQKLFPTVKAASDQLFRQYDLAVDFAEEVDPPLSFEEAGEIQKIFTKLGATARVSSIHVNGWWGSFSKREGLQEVVENFWNKNLLSQVIYVGDSPNDAPLFEAGLLSVGVANIRQFFGKVEFKRPDFITDQEGGNGSCELLKSLPAKF